MTEGWARLRLAWRRRGGLIIVLGPVLLSSCAAAPFLIPVAFEFARNLFQTGLSNYGSKHRDNLSNLVNRLASPYMQGLPPGGPGYPGQPGIPPQQFPGQQAYPGQPGAYDPNNPYGSAPGGVTGFPQQGMPQQYPGQQAYPGQPGAYDPNNPYGSVQGGVTGFPQQGMPQQQYPGQQAYPAQPGAYDPNSPYGGAAPSHSGAATYPGATVNPYGTAQGYPAQPGINPYDPQNSHGAAAPNPYGQQPAPYGTPSPYGQQGNPYGAAGSNPYGAQPPSGSHNPYESLPPQHQLEANPYGTATPPGGAPAYPPQGHDPGNPYGSGGTAQGYGQSPQGYNQSQAGYSQSQPQPGYGSPSPYGTQQPPQGYGGYGASGQPAYGGQPYGAAGIYPRSVGSEPVVVDVAMIRQKQTAKGKEVVLMNDGEVLKDGGANKAAGDRFKIVVRTNCDCYLYIMSIDGSGWAEPIYPGTGNAAPTPVKKDQEYAFPEGAHWYTLDDRKGIETFFVVASAGRRSDLEDSLAQLAAEKRPEAKIVAKVEEPPIIPRGVGSVKARGILKVQDETGAALTVTPLSYAGGQPGQDVTVTRWFKHE